MVFALRLYFSNGTVTDVSYYSSESHAIEQRDHIRQKLAHQLTGIIKAEVIPIDVIPKPLDKLQFPEEIGELIERCMWLQIKMGHLPEEGPLFYRSQENLKEEYRILMSCLAEFLDKENFDFEPFNPYLTGRQLEWLRANKGELLQHLQGIVV
jgi:hypothetical protein